MNVLFAVPRYHPNHDGMVAGLLGAGHSVGFLVRDIDPRESHRAPVTRLPARGRRTPPPFRFILAHLRAARPDVVVARNADRDSYAIFLACRLLGIRYLLYVQSGEGFETMRPGRRIRLALGLWPRHTINSACTAPAHGIPGKTFDFLPFAMELDGPAKADYPIRPPLRILTVGKLDQPRKNHVPLVRALAPLLRDGKAHLTIVGLRGSAVSPVYAALLAEIKAQGLAGRVVVRENLPYADARALYLAHDLFVLASSRERAAISPVEAMAAGLPVVVGADNGTNYFVVPGETGFIFPDGNFAAMAGRVGHFVAAPAELARMGQRARHRIATEFSPADYARRFESIVARRFGNTGLSPPGTFG